MAEAVSVKNLSGQLVCSICKKVFQEMTLSSCFHTFCLDCLKGHLRYSGRRDEYRCPICNTKIVLPEGTMAEDDIEEDVEMDETEGYEYGGGECDICEDRKQAVNRCLQCQENFCSSCTNAHLKMKVSRYHGQRVVPLRRRSKDGGDGRGVQCEHMYCPRHTSQEIIVVCKKCNILLCHLCKLLEHDDHVTRLVSEEASNVRRNIRSLLQRQTGCSENLQMRLRTLSRKNQQYRDDLDNELVKVQSNLNKLQIELEKERSVVEKELRRHFNGHIQRTEKRRASSQRDYDDYVTLSKEAQRIVENLDDVHVVKHGLPVYERLSDIEKNTKTDDLDGGKPSQSFRPGIIEESKLQRMLGRVDNKAAPFHQHMKKEHLNKGMEEHVFRGDSGIGNSRGNTPLQSADRRRIGEGSQYHSSPVLSATPSHRSLNRPLHLIKSTHENLDIRHTSTLSIPFTDGIGYVYGIASAGNSTAWVTLLGHNHVTLIDKGGNILHTVDVGVICEDVASDGKGGCFVTCPTSKSIKHVQADGEFADIATKLSQDPHGITSLRVLDPKLNTMVEELYVCFTETRGSTVSLFDNQKGCVRVLSFSGQELGKSFSLQSPVRIDTSFETGLVCVSDYTNGCVIVSDKSGRNVMALYTGENEDGLYRPLGVSFDMFGCIIIADWKSGDVSRISPDGRLVQILIKEMEGAQAVCIGKDGLLWVGGKQGHIQVYEIN